MLTQSHDYEGAVGPQFTEPMQALATARKKLTAAFVQRDKSQLEARIKDLEKTVQLNKAIIADLLEPKASPADQTKKALDLINKENAQLQSRLKTMKKEQDTLHAQLLISEQMVQDYKAREHELMLEYQEKSQELIDQLDQKEYVLQYVQQKFARAERLLIKYAEIDHEVYTLVQDLTAEPHRTKAKRITNVIEENKRLTLELAAAKKKIANIEAQCKEQGSSTQGQCYDSRMASSTQSNESKRTAGFKPNPPGLQAISESAFKRDVAISEVGVQTDEVLFSREDLKASMRDSVLSVQRDWKLLTPILPDKKDGKAAGEAKEAVRPNDEGNSPNRRLKASIRPLDFGDMSSITGDIRALDEDKT